MSELETCYKCGDQYYGKAMLGHVQECNGKDQKLYYCKTCGGPAAMACYRLGHDVNLWSKLEIKIVDDSEDERKLAVEEAQLTAQVMDLSIKLGNLENRLAGLRKQLRDKQRERDRTAHKIKDPCPKCSNTAMEITLELIIKCFNCGHEIIPTGILWESSTYFMRSKNDFKRSN